ncbi:hypothetical protein [Leucobacter celer]|uniref:hypothetical protein n=1 Tax=Leucobacter celer TaxID=668625 RepID=UPI0006A77A58|nr:hypothetical protein [Leucobacter celer]
MRAERRCTLTAAAAATTSAALLLSGCSLHLMERGWASDLREVSGVVASDWSYRNNWPSSGPHSTGELTLEPGVTADQARKIAQTSCESASRPLDRVEAEADAADGSWHLRAYDLGDSCFPAERLVAFSGIAAAATGGEEPFSGSLELAFFEADELSAPSDGLNPELRLTATAAEVGMLAPFLDHLRPAVSGFVAEIELGDEQKTVGTGSPGPAVSLRLAPGEFPSALPELLGLALKEDFAALRYEGNALTVAIASSSDLPAARSRLLAASEGHDLAVDVRLPRMTGSDDPGPEDRLVEAVLALPGVERIEFDRSTSWGPGPVIRVSDTRGLDELVTLLVEQNPGEVPFRILGPGEDQPLELDIFGGALSSEEVLHLYEVADEFSAEVTGVELVMVRVLDADRTLLRIDIAESASAAEAQTVRDRVRALVPDPAFDRIIISDPDSDEFSVEIKDGAEASEP